MIFNLFRGSLGLMFGPLGGALGDSFGGLGAFRWLPDILKSFFCTLDPPNCLPRCRRPILETSVSHRKTNMFAKYKLLNKTS